MLNLGLARGSFAREGRYRAAGYGRFVLDMCLAETIFEYGEADARVVDRVVQERPFLATADAVLQADRIVIDW